MLQQEPKNLSNLELPGWLNRLNHCRAINFLVLWPRWAHITIWSISIVIIFVIETLFLPERFMVSFYILPLIYGALFLPKWTDAALVFWSIILVLWSRWGNFNSQSFAMVFSAPVVLGLPAYFARTFQKLLSRERQLLKENERLNEHLVYAFAKTIEFKDEYTMGHSIRVAEYASQAAIELHLPQDFVEKIYTAGLLHDVGKIGVRETVLLKQGPLTQLERSQIQGHVELGVRILQGIPGFAEIESMVSDHHERWDGLGYPYRKAGEDISLGGRILAVADAYDAMTSHRVYREPVSQEQAFSELMRCENTQFDPVVVKAFVQLKEQTRFLNPLMAG